VRLAGMGPAFTRPVRDPIDAHGFAPHDAFEAMGFGRDDSEDRFAALAERIAEGEGRKLTRVEL
jgi:hypothetical protein